MGEEAPRSAVDPWDARASADGLYAVLSRRWSEEQCAAVDGAQRDHVLGLLPPLTDARVLDLGCGVGRVSAWASEAARSTVALDRSSAMVRRAARDVPAAAVAQASVGALPVRSDSFDVVLAIFVLQHVLDEEVFATALAEIGRVVRPRGWVVSIDGLADERRRAGGSSGTVVRTIDDHAPLAATCELVRQVPHRVVEDDYVTSIWRAR